MDTSQRLCPFTMKAPESTSIITKDTHPGGIVAAPCAQQACVAFTIIYDESGKPVSGDCRLCMASQMLNGVVEMLDANNQLLAAALQAQGIDPTKDQKKETH
ncbi:MAG: hypothetical protein WC729_29370 [Sphingomonas sp.]|jgi:proline racemase|uniref:hypothetical protein n=1 Tax=Sphingomonas sp. TaxID=28214 RepID=UPI0035666ADA